MIDDLRFAIIDIALRSLSHPQLKQHSEAIASLVVPGSQHWRVYRIAEEQR